MINEIIILSFIRRLYCKIFAKVIDKKFRIDLSFIQREKNSNKIANEAKYAFISRS